MSRSPRVTRRALPLTAPARNVRQKMDGLALLKALPDRSVRLGFCDPQYRAVLDQLDFGNEGARQGERHALPQMTDETIALFVEEFARVLMPSGHLMLWCDKFSVASGHHHRWAARVRTLPLVEMIHWRKLRPGMGHRGRGVSEYLIIRQKIPKRAKDVWTDHGLLDSWTEGTDRDVHPHAKPYVLTERLIRATTKRGDLVVDPCAGSYVVLEACKLSGREFIGCDLEG